MNHKGELRIATFNIKHGATADGYRGYPDKVAEACASLNADILALQEVDRGVTRSRWANMAALAAKASGMQMVFAKTMWFRGGLYGNALLVRGEIKDVEVLDLPGDHRYRLSVGGHKFNIIREPRNAILATAIVDDTEYSVAVTHFATVRGVSEVQLQKTLGVLSTRPKPRILIGDFNLKREDVLPYLPTDMHLAEGQPTELVSDPSRSIDHIAVSGLNFCGDVERKRFPISDHLAVVAKVKV